MARTIKPAQPGKKEGAVFSVWFRLNEEEMASLAEQAEAENLSLNDLLTQTAVQAIEQKARPDLRLSTKPDRIVDAVKQS
jgi:hypothetical protein